MPSRSIISWLSAAAFVAGYLCLLILWSIGLIRTGLRFFYLLVLSAGLFVLISVVQLAFYYNPAFIVRLLDRRTYDMFYYGLIWVELFNMVITIIAQAMLIRWICRAHARTLLSDGNKSSI